MFSTFLSTKTNTLLVPLQTKPDVQTTVCNVNHYIIIQAYETFVQKRITEKSTLNKYVYREHPP